MAYNKKQALVANISALDIALKLRQENSSATQLEKTQLENYSGFGGLRVILKDEENIADWNKNEMELHPHVTMLWNTLKKYARSDAEYWDMRKSVKNSVMTAFYTPERFLTALREALSKVMERPNKILEPSAGNGRFVRMFDKWEGNGKADFTAFEKDIITGTVLKALQSNAKVNINGFENIPHTELGTYDMIISNIPFGDVKVYDPLMKEGVRKQATNKIHSYFFVKGLDALRGGGLLVYITSRGVADSATNRNVREYLMQNSNLISAIRLPDNLFANDGISEIGTDLIILQKNSKKQELSHDEKDFIESDEWNIQEKDNEKLIVGMAAKNRYINSVARNGNFGSTNYDNFIGWPYSDTDQFGHMTMKYVEDDDWNIENSLSAIILRDFKDKYNKALLKEEIAQTIEEQPELTLWDIFGLTEEERSQIKTTGKKKKRGENNKLAHAALKNVERPYLGDDNPNYMSGSIVYYENELGTLKKENNNLTFVPQGGLTEEEKNKLILYAQIRNAYWELFDSEKTLEREQPDMRESLNRLYDDFIQQNGGLREAKNTKLLMIDPSYNEIAALEKYVDGERKKADIFFQPVSIIGYKEVEEILSPDDALASCLNIYGEVDLDFIEEKTELPQKEIIEKLQGKIYYNPRTEKWEDKNVIIAGDVYDKIGSFRHKLELMKLYADEYAEEKEKVEEIIGYTEKTLEALEMGKPQFIPFEELDFNFGERWIPTSYYENFIKDLLNIDKAVITYIQSADQYNINIEYNYNAMIQWKVSGKEQSLDTKDIISNALLNNFPELTYKAWGDNGRETVVDAEATQMAAVKIQDMRDKFVEWFSNMPLEEKDFVANLYNERFNCFVRPHYDGSFQTFPGLSFDKFDYDDLYPSQKDAILMIKQNGGGICDHEVGAGKTMIMCVAAQEMKRLGLVNKPMIIAMKANVHEIAETYKKAYPNAKVLYPSQKDFQKENRQRLFMDIKNNNYDCIILSHEQFDKIPQSLSTQAEIMTQELYDIDESLRVMEEQREKNGYWGVNGRLLSGLEKRKQNMEVKLKELMDDINHRIDDINVDFRDMGIDHIFVDESHKFKNLMFQTRQQRLAGLGNTKGSQRSTNLFVAIRDIQSRTGKDLGATFLSGTTISNSLTELYVLFKYLRPQALQKQNITCFDAWSAVFTRKTTEFEFNVTNQIVQKERLRYFIKVPELAMFYNQITDYRTAALIGIQRPEKREIFKNIPPQPEQENYIKRLMDFARTGDGKYINRHLTDTEIKAKMLIATNLSNKMALDMRLIDEFEYETFSGGKVDVAAANINEYYQRYNEQKGTQFVFADLGTYKQGEWNIYSAIRNKLVQDYNIPEEEIVFIQECTTEKKKKKVLDDMNSGKVRVLFGSTNTLGTGVNAQQRAVALHHIDAPWRPSDLEQREGRAIRKGNIIARDFADNKVDIITYATERSLDAYKFNLLNNKQMFISQLKNQQLGSRTMDEGGYDETNGVPFAEYVAILSGNTDLLDKAKLDKKITALEREKMLYNKETTSMQRNVKFLEDKIDSMTNKIPLIEKDWKNCEDRFVFLDREKNELNGKEIGKYVNRIKSQVAIDKAYLIGSYSGLKVMLYKTLTSGARIYLASEKTGMEYSNSNKSFPMAHAEGEKYLYDLVQSLPERANNLRDSIKEKEEQIIKINEMIAVREWPKKDELESLKKESLELEKKITATLKESEKNSEVGDTQIIENEANTSSQCLSENEMNATDVEETIITPVETSISENTGIIQVNEVTEPFISTTHLFGPMYVSANVGGHLQIATLTEEEKKQYALNKTDETAMVIAKDKFANQPMQTFHLDESQNVPLRLYELCRFKGRQIEVFPSNPKLNGGKTYVQGKCVNVLHAPVVSRGYNHGDFVLKIENEKGEKVQALILKEDKEDVIRLMNTPIKQDKEEENNIGTHPSIRR